MQKLVSTGTCFLPFCRLQLCQNGRHLLLYITCGHQWSPIIVVQQHEFIDAWKIPLNPNKQWQLWYVLSLPCLWRKPGSRTMHPGCIYIVHGIFKFIMLTSMPRLCWWRISCKGTIHVLLSQWHVQHSSHRLSAHLPTKDISPWGPSKAATLKKSSSQAIVHGIFTMGMGCS